METFWYRLTQVHLEKIAIEMERDKSSQGFTDDIWWFVVYITGFSARVVEALVQHVVNPCRCPHTAGQIGDDFIATRRVVHTVSAR